MASSCSVGRYAAHVATGRRVPTLALPTRPKVLVVVRYSPALPIGPRARGPPCRRPRRGAHRTGLDPDRRSARLGPERPRRGTAMVESPGSRRSWKAFSERTRRCLTSRRSRSRYPLTARRRDRGARRVDLSSSATLAGRCAAGSSAGSPGTSKPSRPAPSSRQPRGALFAPRGGASPRTAGRHSDATGSPRWQRIVFVIPDVSMRTRCRRARSASSRRAALAERQISRPSNRMQTSHSTALT